MSATTSREASTSTAWRACARSPSCASSSASWPTATTTSRTGAAAPPSLSVVFPMRNEKAYIRRAVAAARAVLEAEVPDWEIVIVDDASTDGTGAIADELAGQDARVRVVHSWANLRLGGALRARYAAARAQGGVPDHPDRSRLLSAHARHLDPGHGARDPRHPRGDGGALARAALALARPRAPAGRGVLLRAPQRADGGGDGQAHHELR